MDQPKLSALFWAIMEWSHCLGATNLSQLPGLWAGKTSRFNVKLNLHNREVDAVPPLAAVIDAGGIIPLAIVGPVLGWIARSHVEDENEDGLIAHFKSEAAALSTQKDKEDE